jgi:hypothetical protein
MKGCMLAIAAALLVVLLPLALLVAVLTPVAGYAASQTSASWSNALLCPTSGARPTPTASARPKATGPLCPNLASQSAVVRWAAERAAHLYGAPDTWYDRGFPVQALAYWELTCPGCAVWQNGDLQCVMFAAAAYGLAGLPLYFGPSGSANAIDFWGLYAGRPGWTEIEAAWATRAQRGLPQPGDLMVWDESFAPSEGHMAIVLSVVPPHGGEAGWVTFAEANGPAPIVTEPLLPDLSVATWPGGEVVGYIRSVGASGGPRAGGARG